MPSSGLEHAMPGNKRLQKFALDSTATRNGKSSDYFEWFLWVHTSRNKGRAILSQYSAVYVHVIKSLHFQLSLAFSTVYLRFINIFVNYNTFLFIQIKYFHFLNIRNGNLPVQKPQTATQPFITNSLNCDVGLHNKHRCLPQRQPLSYVSDE